jgi:hypothetical protein
MNENKALIGELHTGCTEVIEGEPVECPREAPKAEQAKSKQGRGGKRPGSGRKPNLAKRLLSGVKPTTAADILSKLDTEAIVNVYYVSSLVSKS